MRRAWATAAALLALGACSLRKARTDAAPPCAGNAQCDPNNVCFLGECRPAAASLSQVAVEVRPPNDSQLGVLQRAHVDLHASAVVDFQLLPLLDVNGVVVEAGDGGSGLATADGGPNADGGVVDPGQSTPIAGATLTFTDHAPAIPDRVRKVTTHSGSNGAFATRLPAATWDLVVQPVDTAGVPPFSLAEAVRNTGASLGLRVPNLGLTRVTGLLSAGGVPLAGASVSAIDPAGEPLAMPVNTVDGGFELVLPPGPPPFRLQVSPELADGGVGPSDPLPNFLPFGPAGAPNFTDAAPIVKDLGPLPPAAALTGTVIAAHSGLPIAGARVSAVSTDGSGWTISRTTTAAADGSYALQLRAGNYLVEAAPETAPNLPAVSQELDLTVAAAGARQVIQCLPKSRAYGLVLLPGSGKPVGEGYQVTATRLPDRVVSGRTAFTTATDSAGIFHLVGDAGRYRLEIVPPHGAALPRKSVQIELADGGGAEVALPAIQLSPPLTVYGSVTGQATGSGAAGGPVANATVDFFAVDASGKSTVFLGTGLTDASGHYSTVLPDVPAPGLLP